METMDYKEAAEFLHITEGTLRKWVMKKKDEIPFHKPGGKKILFFREELEEWIKKTGSGDK